MLPKEQMDAIAGMIGIKADVFAQAFSDEQEVKLELPEGRFLTTDQEETLKDNVSKKKYDEGRAKERKDAFEGKSKEEFLNDYKKTIIEEAKIEPKKQVEALQQSLEDLQKKYTQDIEAKESIIKEKEISLSKLNRSSKLQGLIPNYKEGMNFADAKTIFEATHEVKEDGVYRNGELLKNDLQSPISLEDAFKGFVNERGWSQETPRGNGGGSTLTYSGGEPKNYEEFEKYCESQGIKMGSQVANEKMQEFATKNPEFLKD